ncbi:probable methyltransferase-like protein 24 [Mercenaria mercenaria]|uniref:probable methyltransferase-like protein 24 n=1 Tax=Mercenaria mercenaria TaxID=6596 RepID=UPI00234EC54C|nr:probable methyltransferase-like protein 24 [Mercenaria mercenaria]
MRFGNVEDGGKEICLDELYIPKQHCLVYSFGSNFRFDFEEAVIRHINCEIHTFDPSKPIQGRTIPSGINFHLLGLAGENSINSKGWEMKTLSTLKKLLNHTERVIDILKIDIESGEWTALPEMLESGVLERVKQLSIEIHYDKARGNHQLKTLRKLYEAGFRIFMHEHNPKGTRHLREPFLVMANFNEISMINIKWSN